METYVEKYCFDGKRGMFCLGFVKKSTIENQRLFSRLKKAMKSKEVKFAKSPGKHYDEDPLMLDTLLPEYLG